MNHPLLIRGLQQLPLVLKHHKLSAYGWTSNQASKAFHSHAPHKLVYRLHPHAAVTIILFSCWPVTKLSICVPESAESQSVPDFRKFYYKLKVYDSSSCTYEKYIDALIKGQGIVNYNICHNCGLHWTSPYTPGWPLSIDWLGLCITLCNLAAIHGLRRHVIFAHFVSLVVF